MKITFLPKTKRGIWSVTLLILSVLLVATFFLLTTVFNQKGGATFFSNLSLTIPMLLAWGCGAASFILSLLAVIKNKPRAVLVFLSMLIGLIILVFGIVAFIPV